MANLTFRLQIPCVGEKFLQALFSIGPTSYSHRLTAFDFQFTLIRKCYNGVCPTTLNTMFCLSKVKHIEDCAKKKQFGKLCYAKASWYGSTTAVERAKVEVFLRLGYQPADSKCVQLEAGSWWSTLRESHSLNQILPPTVYITSSFCPSKHHSTPLQSALSRHTTALQERRSLVDRKSIVHREITCSMLPYAKIVLVQKSSLRSNADEV